MSYTHLRAHSHYSLLSALPKIPEIIERAKKYKIPAVALTDLGNLYGTIEFYKACKEADIRPIIGLDGYMALRTRHDKEARIDNKRTRIVLLAKNDIGYKNLLKLTTLSNLEGFYYKPRLDHELLKAHKEGIIAILPFSKSDVSEALRMHNTERANTLIETYKNIFGSDSLFLEIRRQSEEADEKLLKDTIELGKKHGVKIVACHESYYNDPEDSEAVETLRLVNQDQALNADNGNRASDYAFISPTDFKKKFKDFPEAIENTNVIAKMCDVELQLGKWVFPAFPIPEGKTYDDELRRLVYEGLPRRKLSLTPELEKRIEYELSVITQKGYAPYFLTVSDLLNFAHSKGILTTIRGSVAGSIVTYLAGITNVDPIEYKLPFERFLNPERPSAPDIDMDYADNRRDEMIEYAKQKYGSDKVAQIGTFGTMMARGSVRDVARALSFPYTLGDTIAKLIPMGAQGFPMTIDRAMEEVSDLKKLYKSDKDAKRIIDMAKKIEGCARHISVHAAGVVMAPTPLTDFVPLQLDPKGGKIITQYDMHAVEDAGLLKFDFLGIRNLSILADAVRMVKDQENISVDIENVPLDDPKTFEMLARGETIGLFQLNGSGMTRYLKELRPTIIHDINAMVALYRPGPMESIPAYIERKHNSQLISYLDPRMEEILKNSYGVLTYQDDVLLLAIKLAGYSWLEADKLRKAMGKKIPEVMKAEREKLLAGFIKNGLTPEKAEKLWKLIEPFAAYGFNKAHAASYGKVAYQTAYMKANFPALYMASVLTAESGDVDQIGIIIAETARMGIPVLPPSVNESGAGFTVIKDVDGNKDRIRFGLSTIKNFGEGVTDSIIAERKTNGKFLSLSDFLRRITDKNLNKKSLEALIKAGALDDFGERGMMVGNIERLLSFNKESISAPKDQTSLFGGTSGESVTDIHLEPTAPVPQGERLAWEKELLGLYLSGHPLDKFRTMLEKREINIKKAKEEYREGMEVVLGGIIENIRPISTKKGDAMAFVRLADLTGAMEVVVFPRIFAETKELFLPEKCVAIKGTISHRNGEVSLIAEKVKLLT